MTVPTKPKPTKMNLNSTDDNIEKGDVDIVFGSAEKWMSEEWRRESKSPVLIGLKLVH